MVSRTLSAIILALTAVACGAASPGGEGDRSPRGPDEGAPTGADVMPSDPSLPVPLAAGAAPAAAPGVNHT